jgi:crotonobetainyl-CoA:carnitine CoA-transferase CaiB-like acyl-CoA transferase
VGCAGIPRHVMSKSKLNQKQFNAGAKCTLDGVRILDLSRLVAGNSLTLVLADLGADVIKIEPPSGDTLRDWKTNKLSVYWKVYARNKKSLGLDLRKEASKELIRKLARSAHALVESFRPGTLEEMGLGPEVLLAENPKLVIVRISGWGQTGRFRHKPGFGTLIEGFSGFASLNGFEDREPVLPPMFLADAMAGLYGSMALMVALREVEVNGGKGQVIDLPLLDPLFSMLGPQAAQYQLTGKVKPRTGSRSTNTAPRNVYRTSDDRWVCLSASVQTMAERLFRAIGRDDLVDDPRFKTNLERVKNAAELDAIIGGFIAERTQAENVAFFDKMEVTIGPVYDISQIVTDPYIIEREVLIDLPDDEMTTVPMHNVVPRLSGTPGVIRRRAPKLGEHNEELLQELGLSAAEITELKEQGVLVTGNRKA